MSKPIYVLNGPNLNVLGQREPEIYGRATLAEIETLCESRASAKGRPLVFRQSNREGDLVDWVQEARTEAGALVINAAAYTHTSIALLDALRLLSIPVVECHLSNFAAREDYRRHSFVSLAATGVISGFGPASYAMAVDAACDLAAD
jgi:3-dehydroquinate dehydratase-2